MREVALLPYRSDTLVQIEAPTDVKVPINYLNNTVDGATATFRVYDRNKDQLVAVAASASATVITVTNAGAYEVSHTVEIQLSDNTYQIATVSVVTSTAVTITPALTGNVLKNATFRRIFGTSVAMAEYGTPSGNNTNWGFDGTLADDHPCQIINQEITIESLLIGSAGGGLNKLHVMFAKIVQS